MRSAPNWQTLAEATDVVSMAFWNAGAKGVTRSADNRPAPATERVIALRLRLAEAFAATVKKFRNGKNLENAYPKILQTSASDARILRRLADAADAAKWQRASANNAPTTYAPPLVADSMQLRGSAYAACHVTPAYAEAFYPDACNASATVRASVVASYVVASYCRYPALVASVDTDSRPARQRRYAAMRSARAYAARWRSIPHYLTVDVALTATLSALIPADRCDVCTVLLPVSGQPCPVCAYVPAFDVAAEAWLPAE